MVDLGLRTDDGLTLQAELATPAGEARGSVVLCHPHPDQGGEMRSLVISALFAALPIEGFVTLRFNFRGVAGSTGISTAGAQEPLDVEAAVRALAERIPERLALWLVGWSFGADMALSVADPRVTGWVAIAPPLQFGTATSAVHDDPRPKLIVLAEHDEVRSPDTVVAEVDDWRATATSVIGGASHSFVGRTDALIAQTCAAIGVGGGV